jgi:hypothetical protein
LSYVFVAGIGNSGAEHWQRRWQEKLGGVWLEHADWLRPDRDAWVSDLQKAIWRIPGPQIVIAHSLGCLVLSEWVREHDDPSMAGAFLVAVPDVNGSQFPKTATGFEPPAMALPFPSLVVAARDDPYGSFENARETAQVWGSEFVDVGAQGHINAESGLGEWAEGLALLEGFVSKL